MADEREQKGVPMRAAIGDAAPPAEVEWGGKTVRVGAPTQAAVSRFEALLEQRAHNAIKKLRDRKMISNAEYDRRLVALGQQIEDGDYAADGPLWAQGNEAEKAIQNQLWMLALIHEHDPGFTLGDVRKMLEEVPAEAGLALSKAVPSYLGYLRKKAEAAPESLFTNAPKADVIRKLAEAERAFEEALTPAGPTPTSPSSAANPGSSDPGKSPA